MPGDSLTVLQEYRGFILDGGHGGFAGGHKRLTAAWKELLVETDMMASVPHMPTADEVRGILGTVVGGFESNTTGAGIRVYWVLDEIAATPHEEFANTGAMQTWATGLGHRNPNLGDFVHLMFADRWTGHTTGGISDVHGCYVFVAAK